MTAASPTEWATAGSLGLSAIGLIGLGLAFADADAAYFDPRPAVRRTVTVVWQASWAVVYGVRLVVWDVSRSEAVYPLLRGWVNARHTVTEFGRDTAALVLLLTTSPKGHLA